MAGYSRDFIVSAFADKYRAVIKDEQEFLEFKQKYGYDHYDKVGKDRFRIDTGLDAQKIREYKESLK